MKHNPMIGKHVHNNRESKEGQVLRFMREARQLSLTEVAGKTNMKAMDVDHFENGRRFYKPEDIEMFLKIYNFKPENFTTLMNLKILNKQIVNHLIVTKVLV